MFSLKQFAKTACPSRWHGAHGASYIHRVLSTVIVRKHNLILGWGEKIYFKFGSDTRCGLTKMWREWLITTALNKTFHLCKCHGNHVKPSTSVLVSIQTSVPIVLGRCSSKYQTKVFLRNFISPNTRVVVV